MGNSESGLQAEEVVDETKVRTEYLRRLGIGNNGTPRPPQAARVRRRTVNSREPPLETVDSFASDAPAALESFAAASEPGDEAEDKISEFTMEYVPMKCQDDFRVNYLRNLSYRRVWVPATQRAPQHQTVIIFDWDDTLLCTSYLNIRQGHLTTPAVQQQLKRIEKFSQELLEMAMRLGQTFLITNAMKGWVEFSAGKWLPGLLPTLEKIRIISARTDHEEEFPDNYGEWKIQAFLKVQRELDSQTITNLISLGDSNFEMDAVHVMGGEFSQALIKTIKFRDSPSPEELAKQLELVLAKFEKIVVNARNLKISLERKWVPAPTKAPEEGGSATGNMSQVPASPPSVGV
jgi:hypothetical protein